MRKFKNYNTIELLDDVLNTISITDNELGFKSIELLECMRILKYRDLKLIELYIILEKLEKDEFITQGYKEYRSESFKTKGTYYAISIEGIVFLEMGGYKGQKKESESQKDLISNTFRLTLIVALGTMIAAVYYLFQIYDGKPKERPFVAVLTFLTCVGLICIWEIPKIINKLKK